jgi:hypothetical protein
MRPRRYRALVVALAGAAAFCLARPARAELADVYLRSGLKLRADVTTTDDSVIVQNAAGRLRLPRAEVVRIVPLMGTASQPTTAPPVPPTRREAPRPESGPAAAPELPPAPPLSDEDIQRLKILELRLDGMPEPVHVRFLRKGRQRDLAAEVLDELRPRREYLPEWEEVRLRGQPHEKLQLIARQTGAEHIDRIMIENDPEVFATFRRRILPLVNRSCARSGCHGGHTARVFRLPAGSPSSDTYAYTTFVLLDQMETRHGPLLDRDDPGNSALLHDLLPQKDNDKGHPPVGHGPSFQGVIRDQEDRLYATVLNWINSLRVPHPAYGLTYTNPYAGRPKAPPETEVEGREETPTSPPATTQATGDAES